MSNNASNVQATAACRAGWAEELQEYVEGELAEEEARRVAAHLQKCVICASLVAEMREMMALLQEDPFTVPASLAPRIMNKLQEQAIALQRKSVEQGRFGQSSLAGAQMGLHWSGQGLANAAEPFRHLSEADLFWMAPLVQGIQAMNLLRYLPRTSQATVQTAVSPPKPLWQRAGRAMIQRLWKRVA